MIRISDPAHIGPALADLRLMHGLTQRQICADTGIWQGRVSAYERGHEIPAVKSLLTILGAMDLGLAIVPLGETQVAVEPRWERLIETIAGHIRTAVRGEIENGSPDGLSATEANDHPSAGVLGCTRGAEGGSEGSQAVTPDVTYTQGAAEALHAIRRRLEHDGKLYPADEQMLRDTAANLAVEWHWTPTADGGSYSGPHGPDICPAVGCQHEDGAA
jgi:transcriptional regulator with XRE-family HTH domain